MVDNKAPDKATTEHLKNVADKYEEQTDPVVDAPKTDAEKAYEERSKAYSEGQEEIEAKRKEDAKPYEKLSDLVDEHAEKAQKAAVEADKKKK